MKTLYFEAAGCYILHNDVESGRIRSQMIPKSMIVWNPVCRVSGICILKR